MGKIFTFGMVFSLFIVFFQQKILHFRLSATCCGMMAVHVDGQPAQMVLAVRGARQGQELLKGRHHLFVVLLPGC